MCSLSVHILGNIFKTHWMDNLPKETEAPFSCFASIVTVVFSQTHEHMLLSPSFYMFNIWHRYDLYPKKSTVKPVDSGERVEKTNLQSSENSMSSKFVRCQNTQVL